MVSDRNVSATSTIAWALWVIGGLFVGAGYFVDLWFTGMGLWLSGIGGVMSIRRMFCRQATREREAFEIGREVGQERLHSLR